MFDSTIPYDMRFFEALDRFVQREPWLERDKAMIDPLKIDRHREGQAVQARREDADRCSARPPAKRRPGWISSTKAIFSPPFNEGSHWALPATPEVAEAMQTNFAKPDAYPVEGRGVSVLHGILQRQASGRRASST